MDFFIGIYLLTFGFLLGINMFHIIKWLENITMQTDTAILLSFLLATIVGVLLIIATGV